jgi:hypothetical protein
MPGRRRPLPGQAGLGRLPPPPSLKHGSRQARRRVSTPLQPHHRRGFGVGSQDGRRLQIQHTAAQAGQAKPDGGAAQPGCSPAGCGDGGRWGAHSLTSRRHTPLTPPPCAQPSTLPNQREQERRRTPAGTLTAKQRRQSKPALCTQTAPRRRSQACPHLCRRCSLRRAQRVNVFSSPTSVLGSMGSCSGAGPSGGAGLRARARARRPGGGTRGVRKRGEGSRRRKRRPCSVLSGIRRERDEGEVAGARPAASNPCANTLTTHQTPPHTHTVPHKNTELPPVVLPLPPPPPPTHTHTHTHTPTHTHTHTNTMLHAPTRRPRTHAPSTPTAHPSISCSTCSASARSGSLTAGMWGRGASRASSSCDGGWGGEQGQGLKGRRNEETHEQIEKENVSLEWWVEGCCWGGGWHADGS